MRWTIYDTETGTYRSYSTRDEAMSSYKRYGRLICLRYGPDYAMCYDKSHEVLPMRAVWWRKLCRTVHMWWPLFLFALLLGAGLAL